MEEERKYLFLTMRKGSSGYFPLAIYEDLSELQEIIKWALHDSYVVTKQTGKLNVRWRKPAYPLEDPHIFWICECTFDKFISRTGDWFSVLDTIYVFRVPVGGANHEQ